MSTCERKVPETKADNVSKEVEDARRDYPGAAVDAGDDNTVDPCLVKQDVNLLNDNPRSHKDGV